MKKLQIRKQKVSNSVYLKLKLSCKDPSLPKVSNKPEISKSLILGHVTTVSTNQNTGNSQIL